MNTEREVYRKNHTQHGCNPRHTTWRVGLHFGWSSKVVVWPNMTTLQLMEEEEKKTSEYCTVLLSKKENSVGGNGLDNMASCVD